MHTRGFAAVSISIIVGLIIFAGGLGYFLLSNDKNDVASNSSIPEGCRATQDDVCSLFNCMVSNCWCADDPSGGIVYQKETIIKNENLAEEIVINYLASINSEYNQVTGVLKINSFFFNVFVENNQGEEKVFTVSESGQVLVTVCGV